MDSLMRETSGEDMHGLHASDLRKMIGAIAVLAVVSFLPVLAGRVFNYGDLASYFLGIVRIWDISNSWTDWLWNDRVASGYAILANPQMNPFYPLDWILRLPGSPSQVLTLNISLHYWIAGVGFLVWLRSRGVTLRFAIVLSLAFEAQGVLVSLHPMLDNLQALVWAPWIVWAYQRIGATSNGAWLFMLFCWLSFGAGDPQMILLMALAGAPLVIGDGRRAWIAVLLAGAGLLAQPWLLPFLEGIGAGERAAGIRSMQDLPWGLDLQLLATAIFPSSLQHPGDGAAWAMIDMRPNWLQSLYVGIVPLMLFWRGARGGELRWVVFTCIQFCLAILAIKGWKPIDSLREMIPVLSMVRFPSRYILMIPVVIFFLFGEGLARDRELKDVRPSFVFRVGAVFLAAGLLSLAFGANLDMGSTARLNSWLFWVLGDFTFVMISLSLLGLAVRMRKPWILLLAIMVDTSSLLKVAVQVSSTENASNLATKAEFDQLPLPNDGRWVSLATIWDSRAWAAQPRRQGSEKPRVKMPAGLPLVDVASDGLISPLNITGYRDDWAMAFVMRPARTTSALGLFVDDSLHLAENILWHAGVRYSLVSVSSDGTLNTPYLRHTGKPIALLRSTQGVYLASSHDAIPPIFLYTKLDTSGAWGRVFQGDPSLDPVAMVDGKGCEGAFNARTQNAVSWTRRSSIEYEVDVVDRKGVLVLAEDRYPGWRAVVDGKAVQPKTVNMLQMGVCLDGTQRKVRFEYRPNWIRLVPIQLMLLSVLVVAGFVVKHRSRSELEGGI